MDRKIVPNTNIAFVIFNVLSFFRLLSELRFHFIYQLRRDSYQSFRAYCTPFSYLKQELYHCFLC